MASSSSTLRLYSSVLTDDKAELQAYKSVFAVLLSISLFNVMFAIREIALRISAGVDIFNVFLRAIQSPTF